MKNMFADLSDPNIRIRLVGDMPPLFRLISAEEAQRMKEAMSKKNCPLCQAGIPIRQFSYKPTKGN